MFVVVTLPPTLVALPPKIVSRLLWLAFNCSSVAARPSCANVAPPNVVLLRPVTASVTIPSLVIVVCGPPTAPTVKPVVSSVLSPALTLVNVGLSTTLYL